MNPDIILTEEQERALEAMLAGKNVFLTGGAGTGKSAIINALKKQTTRKTVFLAPTGKAATLIEGQTIHSFFKLPIGVVTAETLTPLDENTRLLLRQVDVIVIDEVSMLRSDVMWGINKRLNQANSKYKGEKVFGGKQIIAVGDFFQLPPVCTDYEVQFFLKNQFGGMFAFNAECWEKAHFVSYELQQIHRQADPVFCSIVNAIRTGDLDAEVFVPEVGLCTDPLTALNHCVQLPYWSPKDVVKLCTTNRQADLYNLKHTLDSSTVPIYRHATIKGVYPRENYPTEENLKLFDGAQVMILANGHCRTSGVPFSNGDCGYIECIKEDQVYVFLYRLGTVVLVEANSWDSLEYRLQWSYETGEYSITQEVVGTFKQLPLKLSYAISIHKSQGSTLEFVHVDLGSGTFCPGQLYTALSRCRNMKALTLQRELQFTDVEVDPTVLNFHKKLRQNLTV